MSADPPMLSISGAVEGFLDQAVFERLVLHVGGSPGRVFGMHGRPHLLERLRGYNAAALHAPWLVLVDLDRDQCASLLISKWLPDPAPHMCFRIAIRSIESWLMADRERLARHLSVSTAVVPTNPDSLPDARTAMVNLAGRSSRTSVAGAMVPKAGSGRPVGPGYVGQLMRFVSDPRTGWRPEVA